MLWEHPLLLSGMKQTGSDLTESRLLWRNQTDTSEDGSDEALQKQEDPGGVMSFARRNVLSSARTPWKDPGISLRQFRKSNWGKAAKQQNILIQYVPFHSSARKMLTPPQNKSRKWPVLKTPGRQRAQLSLLQTELWALLQRRAPGQQELEFHTSEESPALQATAGLPWWVPTASLARQCLAGALTHLTP